MNKQIIVNNFVNTEYNDEFRKLLESTTDIDEQLKLIKQRTEHIEFAESVLTLSSRLQSLGESMLKSNRLLSQQQSSLQYIGAKNACSTVRESVLDMERLLGFKTI